ncbi:MAG: M1 family aminopeptidase, partial [Bacteroidota bacterium]|nr:M1 family aminopeptidase [Bacteroidota bacterium]
KEIGVCYPYQVYRQAPVIDYMYGAMETTTSTIFGDYMLIDRGAFWQRNYINTNAHEMAHQWFGNAITQLVNKDVWLTESFATYYAKIFERSVFGEDQYQNIRKDELDLALNASKTNNYPVGGTRGGVPRIYQKGSLVLDMLRYVAGDREFRDAIRLYASGNLFRYSESSGLERAFYEVTGKSYHWFFDEWVFHGGEPEYKVICEVKNDTLGNRFTEFRVSQEQETNDLTGLFRMPIVFEVHYTDGSFDAKKVMVENKYQEVSILNPAKKRIDFVLFDPGRRIMKKVDFDKPFEELSAQLLRAPQMIDRYDALVALRSFPVEKKRDILIRSYHKETFHLIRSEVIAQLSGDSDPAVMALLKQALDEPDAYVRKAVLQNVVPVPEDLRSGFEKALNDTSYLNIELALENLCNSFPAEADRYLNITRNMTGWRGLNIRMKWLEISIGKGMDSYREELIGYTGPKYEFETRMNSLEIARKLNICDERVLKNAVSAYLHWNSKLSGAGRDVLKYFAQQEKSREIIEKIIHGRQWSEKERTSLNNLWLSLN